MENEKEYPIEGFDNYTITRSGVVYSYRYNNKREILAHFKKGYKQVELWNNERLGKKFSIHRLVAIVFIPKIEGKNQVNHINGIRDDNRVENLEWCTHQENQDHSYEVLGRTSNLKGVLGKLHRHAKVIVQYTKDGKFIAEFYGAPEAHRETGIHRSSIGNCLRGRANTAGGFKWKYK